MDTILQQVLIDTGDKKRRIYVVGGDGVEMSKMHFRAAIFLSILNLVLPSYSQNKVPEPDSKSVPIAKDAPKPEQQHFYFHSWAKDEFKICETYSGAPGVVVCDSDDDIQWKGSFLNLIAENDREGMTEERSYQQALAFASAHGKTFIASFSDDPWPKPQTGFKLSVWNCARDKSNIVACALGGRTTKTTTGE